MGTPRTVRATVARLLPQRVLELRQALRQVAEMPVFLRWRPPGHFYSPVPSMEEAEERLAAVVAAGLEPVAGVDLDEAGQLEWLARIATVNAGRAPGGGGSPGAAAAGASAAGASAAGTFPVPGGRYVADNPSFCLADALTLRAMLLLVRPTRFIEVGSGFSSAVTLDTRDSDLPDLDVTFIEPYPELLESRLRPQDRDHVTILAERVQDVGLEPFGRLRAGDVLFVDSSHVVRVGSDAQFLYGEVLPRLPAGVFVHVHDIFYPFEYPADWVREGRAWNEAYVLRALLVGAAFDILVWNDWLARAHTEEFHAALPGTRGAPGGSIWLRRR